jgi:hypothetical protein
LLEIRLDHSDHTLEYWNYLDRPEAFVRFVPDILMLRLMLIKIAWGIQKML